MSQTEMSQIPTDLSKLTGSDTCCVPDYLPINADLLPGPLLNSSVSPAWIGAFMPLATYI